jgi:uncharacterized membrane protein
MFLPKWLKISFLITASVGILISTYFTASYYTTDDLFPILPSISQEVTTSGYASILNIPTAIWGILYFLTIIMLILFYQDTKNKGVVSLVLPISTIGFIGSISLILAQIFIIKTICPYCMIPLALAIIIFILAIILTIIKKKASAENTEES